MAKPQSPLSADLIDAFSGTNLHEQEIALDELTNIHNIAKEKRRQELRAELGSLNDWPAKSKAKPPTKAKFKSLKNASLTWAGRGQQPTWLVEEMKESGKPLESFRV